MDEVSPADAARHPVRSGYWTYETPEATGRSGLAMHGTNQGDQSFSRSQLLQRSPRLG